MSLFWKIWEVIISCSESLLYVYLLMVHLKRKSCFYVVSGLCMLIFCNLGISYLTQNSLIRIFVLFFCYMILSFYAFEGSITKRFYWAFSANVLIIVATNLTFLLVDLTTPLDISSYNLPSHTRLIMTIIYLMISALFYFLLSRKKDSEYFLPPIYRFFMIILLLLGILVADGITTLLLSIPSSALSPAIEFLSVFISISIIMILFSVLVIFERMSVLYENNLKLSIQVKENELQKEHIADIESSIDVLRKWKHDWRQHLSALSGLIVQGKANDLSVYIQGLNKEYQKFDFLISTHHSSFDAVLSNKIMLLQKEKISFSHELYLPEKLPLSEINLCILMGNLMDNAIESCRKIVSHSNRKIFLCIKPYQSMLSIHLTNSSIGEYKYEDNILLSTKNTGKNLHGIGLSSVQKIVSDATGFFEYFPEKNTFTVNILIPLP